MNDSLTVKMLMESVQVDQTAEETGFNVYIFGNDGISIDVLKTDSLKIALEAQQRIQCALLDVYLMNGDEDTNPFPTPFEESDWRKDYSLDSEFLSVLLPVLREKIVNVTFEKLNGTQRTIRCTLHSGTIQDLDPKYPHFFADHVWNPPQDEYSTHLKVFDLDSQSWKTMIVKNIKNWLVV